MRGDTDLDISQDVLFGIAHLALDQIDGVTPTAPPARVGEILTGRRTKGIRVEREGQRVEVHLNVSVRYGLRIPEVARAAQSAVREAIGSMTGLEVGSVHLTVDSIDLPEELGSG